MMEVSTCSVRIDVPARAQNPAATDRHSSVSAEGPIRSDRSLVHRLPVSATIPNTIRTR
jgi:hypothetical protein